MNSDFSKIILLAMREPESAKEGCLRGLKDAELCEDAYGMASCLERLAVIYLVTG
jgi:hypothetical protein